ncbi:hypothetical protein DFQ26_009779 [Actinomortierella ambigua]|nr:hypothetical protein DFQ26_009779 [Actinomortierella ambigua]
MDPSQEKQYPKGVPPEPPFKLTSASTLNEGPDDDLTLDERECIEHPDVIRKKPSLFKAMPQVLVLPHLLSSTIGILLVISSLVVAAYMYVSRGQVRRLFQNITGGAPVGTILQKQIMDPEGLVHKAFEWHDVSAQPGWTRESLIQEVDLGHYWGLLYIPANFSTALLMNAPTRQGPANISTPVTIEYVFDQGRNYATQGIIEKVMLTTVNGLIQGFLQRLLSSPSSPTLMATMTPSFWVKPIHFSETILHPVLQYGESFASYMVFVVAYIGSLLTVNCIARYLPSNVETFGMLTIGDDKEYRHFPALRIVLARHTVAIMFSTVHSLLIWMVPRVLHGYSTVGSTAFVAFVFTFLCTWSFLSVLFFMCRVFTIDGFQIPATLFLILQLTTSSSIMDWILTPGFYRIGIVFPMTYAVRGMRYIFFGSLKDKMWINWLVIAAYIVVPDTLDAARQARRQEWEKAYKDAENPPPPPEEEPDYDPRTLYERLQEQRQKKDDAFREATKFGNLIKKLDGDEFDFLSNLHEEEDKKKRDMAELEAQALEEFRSSVKSTTVAPPTPVSLSSTLGTTNIGGTGSATSLLASTSAATLISRKPRKSAFSGLVVGKEDKKSGATSPPDTAADSSKRKQGSETTSTGDEKSAAHTNKKLKSDHVGKSAVSSSSSSSSELSNKDTKGAAASSSNTLAVAPKGISSLVSYASDSSDEE